MKQRIKEVLIAAIAAVIIVSLAYCIALLDYKTPHEKPQPTDAMQMIAHHSE